MRNTSTSLVIRNQLQTILKAWGIKVDVPVKGNFNISIVFPGQPLNRGRVKKTKKKSTYNKPLYEIILFKSERKAEESDFISIGGKSVL